MMSPLTITNAALLVPRPEGVEVWTAVNGDGVVVVRIADPVNGVEVDLHFHPYDPKTKPAAVRRLVGRTIRDVLECRTLPREALEAAEGLSVQGDPHGIVAGLLDAFPGVPAWTPPTDGMGRG